MRPSISGRQLYLDGSAPPSIAALVLPAASGSCEKLPVLLVAEAVGHARQVVADRPRQTRLLGTRLKVRRQQLRPLAEVAKQLAEAVLGPGPHFDQPRM